MTIRRIIVPILGIYLAILWINHFLNYSTTQKSLIDETIAIKAEHLNALLEQKAQIYGRATLPDLEIRLKSLISIIRCKFHEAKLPLKHVKLVGGAASFVLALNPICYSDVDLVFSLDMDELNQKSKAPKCFDRIRDVIFAVLLEMMPVTIEKQLISTEKLRAAYLCKMVKVDAHGDRWSMLALNNEKGRLIENTLEKIKIAVFNSYTFQH